jgi:glycosyltransferase involved in cell wall biosynthesis
MKVLYVSSKYGLHDYRFLKKLAEDFEVLFLHYSSNKDILKEAAHIKNIQTIARKPIVKSFPLAGGIRHFKKIYNSFKPDIIHSGYVWQVGILPAFLDLHPHLSMVWGSDVLTEPDKNFIIKRIVRKVMKQADHIQCDAESVKKKIMNDYNVSAENITVFPWGIDLSVFRQLDKNECRLKLGMDKDKFVFMFSRPFEAIYGIENLMDGFLRFSGDKEDVVMYMAHDGPLKKYILDFISEHSLQEKIKVTGWLPNAEIPYWFNAADVVVSTSITDGTPLSLLEAMACGTGLIVAGIPSILEWVSDENGIVIPPKDTTALVKALNKYYNQGNLASQHGRKNTEIAKERADWDKNYLKLREIYKKITAK